MNARIYKYAEFQTLHVKSMLWEVNAHFFSLFLYFSEICDKFNFCIDVNSHVLPA